MAQVLKPQMEPAEGGLGADSASEAPPPPPRAPALASGAPKLTLDVFRALCFGGVTDAVPSVAQWQLAPVQQGCGVGGAEGS